MVGVTGYRLNSVLRSYLQERVEAINRGEPPTPTEPIPPTPRRRVRDRLNEQDLSTLIESFRSGTPAHVLAKRYGAQLHVYQGTARREGIEGR